MAASGSDNDQTRSFMALAAGTKVSHYKIISKIGAGGMGEVYVALDTELNRKVALKFLPPHLCQDEDCRKRFTREAQAAAKLDHPNIVTIHEVGEYQGRPFFAMQFIDGTLLRETKSEELNTDQIIGIALQLCGGLQVAHAAGVIHRDIKPSNILIDSAGRARLLDFGLATVEGGERLTRTGFTLGTVGYMSPEQVEGKPTDARSDLFSLGVVLYELIANRSPFRRDTETATLKAILQDTPEPLARYKSGVPDDLQRVVSKLLEKDPAMRYQSAAGVIPDLNRLSRSASNLMTAKRPVRWIGYVASSAAVVLVAALAVWFFGYRNKTASSSSDHDRIMLAVLPFENLGKPEDEYFADGITEEITARLASVHDLGVIARTSVSPYKHTEKPIQQIGQELGVEYILEGTIRWQDVNTPNARIRITPQLIRVSDATHVWAGVYDEVGSEVFQIQTKIAGLVVNALNISLVEVEQDAITAVPTSSLEAYDYYLQGKEYYDRYKSMEDLGVAASMFEKALDLDSTFAAAHAWLTQLYLTIPNFADPVIVDSLRQLSYQHALKAKEFSSNGFEGHLAMGRYFFGVQQYDKALDEFNSALAIQPNNTEIIAATAEVLVRQGHWEEALSRYERNAQLNPRSVGASWELALTCYYMRRFADGDSVVDRGMSFSPDWWPYKTVKAWAAAEQNRNLDSILASIESSSAGVDKQFIESFKMEFLLLKRDFAGCVALSTTAGNMWHGDSARYYLVRGQAYDQLGQLDKAGSYYDSARTILRARIDRGSTVAQDYTGLGQAYALTHDTALALQFGNRGYAMMPLSKDAIEGALVSEDFAEILTLTGHHDEAIDILDTLLSVPSHMNVVNLQMDISWDQLRDNPHFQALIRKYEHRYDQNRQSL